VSGPNHLVLEYGTHHEHFDAAGLLLVGSTVRHRAWPTTAGDRCDCGRGPSVVAVPSRIILAITTLAPS